MTTPADVAIADYLRQSITRGRDHERIGPFTASFSRASRNPFLNYAIPDDHAEPAAGDIRDLVAAYEDRSLAPRLEYLPDLAPAVEPALIAAGFLVEGRLVLMTPGPPRTTDPPAGIELLAPATDDELRGLRIVQHEAYDDPDESVDDATVARLRSNLAGGAGAILARTTDGQAEPVGAGEYTEPIGGVAEITSIAVRAPWRRRGIAAAITTRLLIDSANAGVTTPFLMANEAKSRVYARVGFEPIGRVLHISRPAPTGAVER